MIDPVYSAAPDRYHGGMKYRRAGKSGILLPEISLGLWHNFGDVDTLSGSKVIMLLTRELLISILLIIMDLLMGRLRKRSGKS